MILKSNIINTESKLDTKPKSKSYEIFKGFKDASGKVIRKRVLGQARIFEGAKTYHVFIKTLLNSRFYLLPEGRNTQKYEYVILTRENSLNPDRKYYWNSVGEGKILMGTNVGLMQLTWDFFNSDNIYMNLNTIEDKEGGI